MSNANACSIYVKDNNEESYIKLNFESKYPNALVINGRIA